MRSWLTWSAVLLGTLALAVNAAAAAVYFYDASQAHTVARGVTIAGIDVGGLSDGKARARLERQLVPRARRTLAIPTRAVLPHVSTAQLPRRYPAFITVSRGAFQLRLFRGLRLVKTYPIAVGRAGLETPAGLYKIYDKQVNPSWHVPKSPWAGDLAGRVIPPGPDDPIKSRWMGFANGAGIHGTDNVGSLGSAASHGCIRMSIPDVEELYNLVPYGTPIYIG